MATCTVADAHGKIKPVDDRDIVVVLATIAGECPFGKSGRRNTSAGVRITVETAVAATGDARVGSITLAEVAVPATLWDSKLEVSLSNLR